MPLADIDAELHKETDKAFLVWDGKEDKEGQPVKVWLPKSQVENNNDGTFTMPEWLALEKELI